MNSGKIRFLIQGLRAKKASFSDSRDPNVWVFGEWFGLRCCDNSFYLANYIAKHHSEIQVIWFKKKDTNVQALHPNIRKVDMDTDEAFAILRECGVAIISQGFVDLSSSEFNYCSGAVTVLLWHGIPWKMIGHDASKRNGLLFRIYKKIYDYSFGADYHLSPSDMYDKIAISAHGANPSRILHFGYPRNSPFYHAEDVLAGKQRIINELKHFSNRTDFDTCKIISYLPTFRDHQEGSFSIESLGDDKLFSDFISENDIIVVQKAHFVNQTRDKQTAIDGQERFYNLNNVAAQDLLCASDLLITDYSGAFFDYLILDRPIIHYLYDYDFYRTQDRGLYYNKEDVIGGEEAKTPHQLIDAIIRNMQNPVLYHEKRDRIKKIYLKYESSDSCEAIYHAIFDLAKKK